MADEKKDIIKTDQDPYRDQKTVQTESYYLGKDRLLAAVRSGQGTFEIIDQVVEEIIEETVNLKIERIKNVDDERGSVNTSYKRAQLLKFIAELTMQKRVMAQKEIINLRGPKLQAVFDHLIGIVKTSLNDCGMFTVESQELFFQKFRDNMASFESEAEKIMKEIEVDI